MYNYDKETTMRNIYLSSMAMARHNFPKRVMKTTASQHYVDAKPYFP